jgi:hypothetical protein
MKVDRRRLQKVIGLEDQRLAVLCRILWDDTEAARAESISYHRAHVLACGLLLYRYATPEQAIWLLGELDKQDFEAEEEGPILTVVNERYVGYKDEVWDVRSCRNFNVEDFQDVLFESHALSIRAVVNLALSPAAESADGARASAPPVPPEAAAAPPA